MTSKYSTGALAGALMLAASFWSYPANALTFHYSFASIEGFISGLVDNQTNQAALSVTVTASSIGGLGEYAPGDVNIFSVSLGTITAASFDGTLGDHRLFFGSIVSTLTILPDGHGLGGTMSISAVPETPLPAALPLFATGLGALGLFGWRRKRKQAA
jgi:hypothetical protein